MGKILLFIYILLLSSCLHREANNSDDIIIDFNKLVNVKDFVDSSYYVKLETTKDCYIGDIKKIVVDESNIYISESGEKKLYIFNKKGDYLRTLFKYGKGHGEYIYLTDFDVYNSTIFVFDNASKNILIYDLDMNLITKISLDVDGVNMKVLNENELCLFADASSPDLYNFVLVNYKERKIISHFDKIIRNESYVFGEEQAFNTASNGSVLITKHFDHTIYSLESGKITPLYKIDFRTKDKIPRDYESITRDKLSKEMAQKQIVRRIKNVYSYDSLLYMIYIAPYSDGIGRTYISKVNITNKEVETGVIGDKEQLQYYPFLIDPIGILNDGTIISAVSYETIDYIQKNNGIEIFKEGGIKEADNPILFFHKLKSK